MPANKFDARPKEARPEGKPLITAWGLFQANRPAWRRITRRQQDFPWKASVEEEMTFPLREFEKVWTDAKDAGATDYYAERGIRLWHRAPAYVKRYIERGRGQGFAKAWAHVPGDHAKVIDRKLR